MCDFFRELYKLLIEFEVVDGTPMVFAAGCAIIGILTVFADLSFFALKGTSLLALNHSPKNTGLFLLAWAFGAAFLGYVGQMLKIFQVSLLACATVGISWPVIITKVVANMREEGESQVPTDEE